MSKPIEKLKKTLSKIRIRKPQGNFAIQSPRRVKEQTAKFLPEYKKEWVKPEKSFREQEKAYRKDGLLKESIDFVVDEICGNGFFVTGNMDYKEKADGRTAIQLINDFNEEINLDEIIQIAARNLVAYGNCFIDSKDPEHPVVIPTKSIERAAVKNKKYNLIQTADYGSEEVKHDDFIHLRWNVDADGILGQGIVLAMLATYEDAPDILASRATMKEMLLEGFKRFGSPNEMWSLPGLSDAKIEDLNKKKNEMSSNGERLFTNVDGKIQTIKSERPSTYDKAIDVFETEFLLIAGNPLLRILGVPSLPPTIGETIKDLHQRRINLLQRIIKRGVEKLWREILEEALLDPKEAHLRLNFGAEEIPKIVIADIFNAVDRNLMSREEARKNLKKYAKFELETESTQEAESNEG